jgi:hypothetical protein
MLFPFDLSVEGRSTSGAFRDFAALSMALKIRVALPKSAAARTSVGTADVKMGGTAFDGNSLCTILAKFSSAVVAMRPLFFGRHCSMTSMTPVNSAVSPMRRLFVTRDSRGAVSAKVDDPNAGGHMLPLVDDEIPFPAQVAVEVLAHGQMIAFFLE